MPSKNTIKPYIEDGYYHIYNRGVNKRHIFLDQQDYAVFLSYLKTYLVPKEIDKLTAILSSSSVSPKEKNTASNLLQMNNFHGHIELFSYCLMPNHFHFLIHQKDEKDIESFMKSSMTRYTRYFNLRHKRVGPLFQDKYKAVLIKTDQQLLYITRYIHRNPLGKNEDGPERTVLGRTVLYSQPSSYQNYLGETKQEWVKPEFVLQNFSSSGFNSYQSFVEDDDSDLETRAAFTVNNFAIDED